MNAPDRLIAKLATLAQQLRIGHSTAACVELPELMTALATQVAAYPEARQQAFSVQLTQAVQSWERHDWLGLADTLEYELTEAPAV